MLFKKCSLNKFILKSTNPLKHFSTLYIPSKELIFIQHPKHGKVYPVYLADVQYTKQNSPKKLLPLISLFTLLNGWIILSGLQFIPMNYIYKLFYFNDFFLSLSLFSNFILGRKYLKFASEYRSRIKGMYLLPCGKRLILETFTDEVFNLETVDIYEARTVSKYEKLGKRSIFVNNDNSFSSFINWGRNRKHFFEGKRIFLDYEVFHYITNRFNIDTTQAKVNLEDKLFSEWTPEEKKKVIKFFRNRTLIETLKENKVKSYFYKMRNNLLFQKKENKIKEEFKLF